jgi:SAM-dependent methyltransferase
MFRMARAPHGLPPPAPALLGSAVAHAASYRPDQVAETALRLLALRPEDRVLELGCGSGRLLFQLAARVRRGQAVGLDPSELMLRHARHRNRRWITDGRVILAAGHSADLSAFPGRHFDAVLAVHVVCFWDDPFVDLAEIRRVLTSGGRLVLGFTPVLPGTPLGPSRDPARVATERVTSWLRSAGFEEIRTHVSTPLDRPMAWVQGRR